MQTVYIETTIPSYLAAKPSSLAAVTSDQRATHEWWQKERQRFRLYTSIFTSDKVSAGDPQAAARRLDCIVEDAMKRQATESAAVRRKSPKKPKAAGASGFLSMKK